MMGRQSMRSRLSSLIVGLLTIAITPSTTVRGQIIGTDLCFCQPVTYTLTLDFSLKCSDTTVNNTIPGINSTACLVESRNPNQNLSDPFPVLVSEILIIELDQNLDPVAQTTRDEKTFYNGDTVSYTSIIISSPDEITPTSLPRGFQVILTGINALEESLTNTWVILYKNDCGIFPLLTEGQQIGWTIFTDLGDPPQSFCPVAPPPPETNVPTPTPSIPTPDTSIAPTFAPTTAPPDGSDVPTRVIPPSFSTKSPSSSSDVPTMVTPSPVKCLPVSASGVKGIRKKKAKEADGTKEDLMKADKQNSERFSRKKERKLMTGLKPSRTPTPTECPEP